MKYLFLVIILLFVSSCYQDKQSVNNNEVTSAYYSMDTFLGTWIIGSFLTNGTIEVPPMNSKIEFQKNGYAIHTLPYKTIDSLNWFINKDTINFKYIRPKTKFPFFLDRKYKMTFIYSDSNAELRLSSNLNFTFILTRPK